MAATGDPSDPKYHIVLEDPASGDKLGLMLTEEGGRVGRVHRLANQYAVKLGQGRTELSDMSDLTVYTQTDWQGGRGQEIWEDQAKYHDASGVETRVDGQLTLCPQPVNTTPGGPGHWPLTVSRERNTCGHAEGMPYGALAGENYFLLGTVYYPLQFYKQCSGRERYDQQGFWLDELRIMLSRSDVGSAPTEKIWVEIWSCDSSGNPSAILGDSGFEMQASVLVSSLPAHGSKAFVTFSGWPRHASTRLVKQSGAYDPVYYVKVWSDANDPEKTGLIFSGEPPNIVGPAAYTNYTQNGQDSPPYPHYYWVAEQRVIYHPQDLSVRFQTAGAITCDGVTLDMWDEWWSGGWGTKRSPYRVGLHADSAGVPGAELAYSPFTTAMRESWFQYNPHVYVSFFWTGVALAASTYYHVVFSAPTAEPTAEGDYLIWYVDEDAGDTNATALWKGDAEAWTTDTTVDRLFQTLVPGFGNVTVNPARYKDKWYIAGGTKVYEWNETNRVWVLGDTLTATVTSLAVWGGYLWAAAGTGDNVRQFNGTAWADAPGPVTRMLLLEYNGYLYGNDATNPDRMYYTADGTNWVGPAYVGSEDWPVTAIAGFGDEVAYSKDVGLWLHSMDWAYQFLDWSSVEDPGNGRGMAAWPRTHELYIPVGHGLYRFNLRNMASCGPDLGTGLPEDRVGNIVALCPTVNWLYAALDADIEYSSILCYRDGGWMEMARAPVPAERCRALGYEKIHSPGRLWYGVGEDVYYIEMPDYSDNPYAQQIDLFVASGSIDLSWWGGELLPTAKSPQKVIVHGEFPGGTAVEVYGETDRSGVWLYIGAVEGTQRVQELAWPVPSYAPFALSGASGGVYMVPETAPAPVAVGEFVRINGQIQQVVIRATDGTYFYLDGPLDPWHPGAGTLCAGAATECKELRLRLALTTNNAGTTPRVLAVACYVHAALADRWATTYDVLLEDGQLCLDGSVFPLDAGTLETLLLPWLERPSPFYLWDIRGQRRRVVVTNASETGAGRITAETPARYRSVYRVNVLDVA